MNYTRIFIFFFGLLVQFTAISQEKETVNYSPGNYFDVVYDKFGTAYTLNDLKIQAAAPQAPVATSTLITCSQAGYFDLYFEAGSGMELNNALHNARRNVLCELFNHLSGFVTPQNPANKVKIWVRNINQLTTNPNVLGVASGFYPVTTGNASGITDNFIYRTITSGVDGYTNFVNPVSISGGTNAGFYHGIMAFNFNQNWHTNVSTGAAMPDFDLYSVALHEVTHALGFASLIDLTGNSQINQSNWYSRYDQFLKTQGNVPLITNPTSCQLYNFTFNPALNPNILYPNCTNPSHTGAGTDHSNCSTAIHYAGSVTSPVYTPDCFEYGSSLSHFEDECYAPATFSLQPPASNNMYYVMSNANGPATNKRHLSPEERMVLCDLGYRVNNSYGSISTLGSVINYTQAACLGAYVAGVNDGLNGGTYNFTGNVSASINIPASGVNGILSNDVNANAFECLRDVFSPVGTSNLNITGGTSLSNIIYSSTSAGVKVLQYIPYNSTTGKRGNITYIYVYVNFANCSVSACDLVNNGGFENSTGCGIGGFNISCWSNLSGTTDLLTTSCTASSAYGGYRIGMNTLSSIPASGTWNNAVSNTHFAGIWSCANQPGYGREAEAFQSSLSSPLVNGQSYDLSFYGVINNNTTTYSGIPLLISNTLVPAPVEVWAIPNILPSIGTFSNPATQLPAGSVKLGTTMMVPKALANGMIWQQVQQTFTYTSSVTHNAIAILVNPQVLAAYTATLNPPVSALSTYVYFDDLSIRPSATSPVFSIPDNTLCINSPGISNLQLYASPPGGTFSGPGVSSSGGVYSFNPALVVPGIYVLTYSVTNNGCTFAKTHTVQVVNASQSSVSITSTSLSTCSVQNITLTATGGITYTWQPGNSSSNPFITSPSVTTTYTVSANTGCGILSNTITIQVFDASSIPPLTVSSSQANVCAGSPVTLTAQGAANSYTWQPGGATTNSISITPAVSTTYSVSGNTACGILSNTITINTFSPASITANASQTLICSNATTTLSAIGSSGSYTWQPGNAHTNTYTVAPGTTTQYTVSSDQPCSIPAIITISVTPTGSLSVTTSTDTLCKAGSQATLTASGPGVFNWQPGNYSGPVYTVSPQITTTYTVETTFCNTLFSESITIVVNPNCELSEPIIPNVFTPNGDGINDVWKMSFPVPPISCQVSIYNRWGTLLFSTSRYDDLWNGTTPTGEPCSHGTYFYILDYSLLPGEHIINKGFITLTK